MGFHESNVHSKMITQKGVNSLVILGAWNMWNHRNWCVFDGAVPNINQSIVGN